MMSLRSLYSYLALTFGIAWSVLGVLILFPAQAAALVGPLNSKNPLFILAVYSPAISALLIVARMYGRAGLREHLRRILLWRAPLEGYAFILFGIPALYYCGAALKGNLADNAFPPTDWPSAIAALAFMLVLGPIEEIGWRGFALPMLQRRYLPIQAGLILGAIWGVWHLPAFFLSGVPQASWSILPFLIGSTALGVILTPLFNAARGSILLPMLAHWQLINPLFPDAAPHDTLFFVLAAIVVTVLNRKAMFSRTRSITCVT